MLGEHVDRLGALRATHPLGERGRSLVVGHLVERGHDGGTDAVVQVGCRLRVERVDAKLEGGSQGRVGVEAAAGGPQQVVGELAPGPDVHAHREVDAGAAERGGRVQPAAGHVEGVTGASTASIAGGASAATPDGIAVVGPGLVPQRRLDHGRAHLPVLLPVTWSTNTSCTS